MTGFADALERRQLARKRSTSHKDNATLFKEARSHKVAARPYDPALDGWNVHTTADISLPQQVSRADALAADAVNSL